MSQSLKAALLPSVYINSLNESMQAEDRRPLTVDNQELSPQAMQAIVPVLVIHIAQNLIQSTGLDIPLSARIVESLDKNAPWRLSLEETASSQSLTLTLFYFNAALKVLHNTEKSTIELSAFMREVEEAYDVLPALEEAPTTHMPAQVTRVLKSVGGLK